MNFFVGITDNNWHRFLAAKPDLEEVNFWQPSGRTPFKVLQRGELFIFKLHMPEDYVVGYGIFGYSNILPISLVWKFFDENNGVSSLEEMKIRIKKYRGTAPEPFDDYNIGCIMLQNPVFLKESQWFKIPGWDKNIVQGKTYDLESETGKMIWKKLNARIPVLQGTEAPRYGKPTLIFPRLGQGTFKSLVLDTYNRHCAITGEKILPVLESAHIKPYKDGGLHSVNNGILFKQDIHTLFDLGYVTVSQDYHFEVSKRIKTEFDNGRNYYLLHGKEISLPQQSTDQPDKSLLKWHNETIFRG